VRHGLISLAGSAALLCWAALLPLAPALMHAVPDDGVSVLGGAIALTAILLTAFWAKWRWYWWRTKIRAEAWTEGRYEMREQLHREAEREREASSRRRRDEGSGGDDVSPLAPPAPERRSFWRHRRR
jgi:hypothetical protein